MNKTLKSILIVDSRKPLPSLEEAEQGQTASYYSILGLPVRREAIRKFAVDNNYQIDTEALYEMGNPEYELAGAKQILEALNLQNNEAVYIDNANLLQESGLSTDVLKALKQTSNTIHLA